MYTTHVKICAYPGLAYIGFELPVPRALLLGLAKFIY